MASSRSGRPISPTPSPSCSSGRCGPGATAISRRFQLALAWLVTGALLGALLPVLGVAVIVAFNAFYWLPIRGESPARDPDETTAQP